MALIPRPEPTSFFSEVFYFARHLASRLKNGPARMASRSRYRSIQRADGLLPTLNYGRMASPVHSALPIGGEVKLIPLKQKFPEQFQNFNLVYLVSSALPPDAEILVARAKALGIPLVWNQNGVGYPGWCGDFYPWFNRRMARLRAQADFIFDQSRFSRLSADRYLGPVHAESETLFNPVDIDLFSPATTPPATSVWNILAAGTSHALYRTKSVIDSFKVLLQRGRKVHLSMAGEFRWRGAEDDVNRELKGIESHVRILPPFAQSEAPDIYRSAHVLLHTKYNDPCPTVPIEAMSCGVPVVGTRSGGMPELVSNACGVLVDVPASWTRDIPGDPEDLANAVEAVMSRHAEMSDAARAHAVVEFDAKKWVGRHEEVFKHLLRA